jgi:hypothetical protein
VDLATRWVAPEPGTRSEDAYRLFLDYDGSGSRVAGDSVRATSEDTDAVGAFAVRGQLGRLWVLLFNKDTAPREARVTVVGGLAGSTEGFRFDPANPLGGLGPVALTDGGFDLDLPARSATLVVARLEPGELFLDGFESADTSAWSGPGP